MKIKRERKVRDDDKRLWKEIRKAELRYLKIMLNFPGMEEGWWKRKDGWALRKGQSLKHCIEIGWYHHAEFVFFFSFCASMRRSSQNKLEFFQTQALLIEKWEWKHTSFSERRLCRFRRALQMREEEVRSLEMAYRTCFAPTNAPFLPARMNSYACLYACRRSRLSCWGWPGCQCWRLGWRTNPKKRRVTQCSAPP